MASGGERPATVADVHELAAAMPHVTRSEGPKGNPIYAVGGKSFVFFRTPRPDAADPETGERYDDVIMFWVGSEEDKRALVSDLESPFFTTPRFDGHPSVLIRAAHLGGLSHGELAEVVQDAWLSRASAARAARWLNDHDLPLPGPAATLPQPRKPFRSLKKTQLCMPARLCMLQRLSETIQPRRQRQPSIQRHLSIQSQPTISA